MSETLEILQDNLGKALWDTFFMVGVATLVGVVLGTALAVLLYLTQHRLFTPNHAVNEMVGFVVNAIRSMPFLILLVVLIPLIQLLIGDPYTPTGGAIALSIAAVPFFARVAESAFQEVDEGLLEAAISTGAPLRQIIFGAIFPQALPSYIRGIVLTIISLLGYSAMVGTIGAGGIGDLAIQYGYNRYETGVLVAIVLLLIVLVQVIQWVGDRIAVIKLGILQQVGAPTELYDRPANVFVAGFIGSPSMNINTHPVVNGKAQIGADTMELPKEALDKLTPEDKNEIIVGFRPEDASLAAPDEANAFSLKVVNVEDLGSDGYIYGNIITDDSVAQKTTDTLMSDQNQLTTIRVNPRVLPKVGDVVKIKVNPAKMHLFSPSTELRLN